jgi:hypothetical protein
VNVTRNRAARRAVMVSLLVAAPLLAAACGGSASPGGASAGSASAGSASAGSASAPAAGSGGSTGAQQPVASASEPAASAGGAGIDACKLLTPAQASAAVGEKVGKFRQSLPGITDSCTATLTPGAAAVFVTLTVHQGIDPSSFNLVRPSGGQPVSGLGGNAYCIAGLLEALQGSNQLNVTSDSCPHSAALARIALPRL